VTIPELGAFVQLRGRTWLVEGVAPVHDGLSPLRLACVADDAQGETLDVLWDAEIAASVHRDNAWEALAAKGTDDPEAFGAYLRTVSWSTATAADRDLFQSPFRAGIRLDAYQLLPLRKALRLPRVNMLIADDVGLGKTVEAGLILRELLLRRRIDLVLVAAPPSMTLQWQDELEAKFGLSFDIIDRERLSDLRRLHGFSVNPWATGSRFILSHRLLTEEAYVAPLRDLLGDFRPRALLILDEAHHAAPASSGRYAIDSQITRAVRDLAGRFEHRLFLSATPHNGHSNSFSALLEMLDPQRFTRGVDINPKELEPVMVRRLKADLRRIGESFPERIVEAIGIDGLSPDAPELSLARMLADYARLREERIGALPPHEAAHARIVLVGLQQRLLSSIAAFARTLKAHRKTLARLAEGGQAPAAPAASAASLLTSQSAPDPSELDLEDEAGADALIAEDDAAVAAATVVAERNTTAARLKAELAAVDAMLAVAEAHATKPDARVRRLTKWINENLVPNGRWNERRIIIFTEFEDTRRWVERRLREAIADTDQADDRIGVFTGATSAKRREALKEAFNTDPAKEPLRILICTDAAREGINLQMRCADLIHLDLPWNPSRLEQRNGRIDRKLQPASQVTCRYFIYAQRPEDIVLEALVRKTETIRNELGAIGQVIETRIADRLNARGIERDKAKALAQAVANESDADRLARARAEMDDEEKERHARLLADQDKLRADLERARKRVGVDPKDLTRVLAAALARIGIDLNDAKTGRLGQVDTFRLDTDHPTFAHDPTWADAFDDLRPRRRARRQRMAEWRRDNPVRAIAFEPPILPNGADAGDVVQVHLEHRLVRRLLSRFQSHGFQADLNRAVAIRGKGAQPRVVLLGRLSLYGPGAARLHEEIIPVTAIWTEADRTKKPLKPLGERGEDTTLEQLEEAIRDARAVPETVTARVTLLAKQDVADLRPELEKRAAAQIERIAKQLAERGEAEAASLQKLLEAQRARIGKARETGNPDQYELFNEDERRQLEANRRHWALRLQRLQQELTDEPQRVRQSYEVRAHRLEPIGLVYLWPASG
jgi:superfamily II DNA or RNA helicase